MDWREKEVLLEHQKALEKNIEPIISKWFNYNDSFYKVVKGKGLLLLLEVTEGNIVPLRIEDYLSESNTLKVKDKLGKDFRVMVLKSVVQDRDSTVNKYEPYAGGYSAQEITETTLTPFGRELITEEELASFKSGMDDLRQFLEERGLMVDALKITTN
ncbi:hypothetical protein MFMK1_002992 [Metallumcola ferriviriculae]|uniref:Uncharacterized protein n=1 Tax=Metallumcola ferriviriculae TaxID=3039180 RepID=A0AAU0UV30_9FIRM|nr:hypothetical protein MFMK1_002992 [Desulfitibacteraceae bacterium MK1]